MICIAIVVDLIFLNSAQFHQLIHVVIAIIFLTIW